ncbi:TPA: helix-turn-helix transcriptional regulator, partial [Campylobacter fetus subsp. venerealis]|nr:helix-turn-helix transcriptional regulator [Campylobacter fetus subsp. venerealis]
SNIFNILHNAVESQNLGNKISQSQMAERLGVSMRTYQDWRLGTTNPQAAMAICKMLCELDDEEALHTIKKIKKALGNRFE